MRTENICQRLTASQDSLESDLRTSLENILNSHNVFSTSLEGQQIAGSIFNYGLSNLAKDQLSNQIRDQIQKHEPRLNNVAVELIDENDTSNSLLITIAADLAKPQSHQSDVLFQSTFSLINYNFSIR